MTEPDNTTNEPSETEPNEFQGTATYCPEDNKLRLYVGRVPRPDYDRLRAAGWVSTPKQSEKGGGEFAVIWTPEREDMALEFAEIIEDEDKGPDERAADRAERFEEYRGKRMGEATGHADSYDNQPTAHGYQSQARAERSARRHDRQGSRAVSAWSKAEYWQSRTAGVISHALYCSAPGVRMGRIKTLEAELRRFEQYTGERGKRWAEHTRLRLSYENQMLEAQGGRAAHIEMEPGGFLRGGRRHSDTERQIVKVNKSHVTGRVVSVVVRDNFASSCNHYGNPYPDGITHILSHTIETERMEADAYRAPTPEEKAAWIQSEKARKAAKPKAETIPLINPSQAEAERLQAALNTAALADHCARHLHSYGKDYASEFKPSTVCTITQAQYSAASGGSYSRAETRGLCKNAQLEPQSSNMWSSHAKAEAEKRGPAVCKIRITQGDGSDYGPRRVIVLTDKPQKPLPSAVWGEIAPEMAPEPAKPEPEPATPPATEQPDLFNLDAAIARARQLVAV